jgi:predicted unusual protein kinase regulating ubiquinone biosynthesis (AarF/ABC1/UbiB family)
MLGQEDKNYWVKQALSLTKELGELKGSVMKAGQMLSVYGEHFLPKEVNLILKQLQFESPPLEWVEMQKIINRNLGKEKAAELEIETESIACASLGQVHRAKIKSSGKDIVLKIQYPNLDKAIDSDIRALKNILSLSQLLPKLPALDSVFAEIKAMLKQELDYEQERKELEFFRTALANDDRFVLPEPIPTYSTKKILAMTYLPGTRVDSAEVKNLSQSRRNTLGEAALSLYLDELFIHQAVQTDPHFGNYRIQINSNGGDKIVLYDFGAVRRLEKDFIEKYRELLASVFHHDKERFFLTIRKF